ncbi:NUDIX domain-containing protein [Paracoccus tegillarcae]|uniref:NUDIX hydrolase n=1 Tax=Paracoccus tegillarcae TaxID=1529068 RepID=A0A2K9EVS3_9RHOB|nr:NUDIX domain-containing protein [Paracoccus tegillarcae]AUH35006.1 NUDIX hydrolase [Paracoccus tegillarcae]
MNGELVLVGPMAHPMVRNVLGLTVGREMTLDGRLTGGMRAGIARHGWPVWQQGPGQIAAVAVAPTPALMRYAEVMGLAPVPLQGMRVLGALAQGPGGIPWDDHQWPAHLAAEIAQEVLAQPAQIAAAVIASRLPMIGVWADSRLRAKATPPAGGGLVGPIDHSDDTADWQLVQRSQPYADFFAVEEWRLSHRLISGGWSAEVKRAGFVMGDAVVVLPWDPVRDRVLLIDQFRVAPAMRGDPQPWLLETIAGRIDVGETPEIAARREAMEEARLPLGQLFPAIHNYPSPGAVGEFLYLYVAQADLPDDAAGIHGLDSEHEDIRSHILPREQLQSLTATGQVSNGPLALLAMWLQLNHTRLQQELAAT